MTTDNSWYDGIKKQIELLKDTLNERDYKKYKLRLLLCVAERLVQFSPECGQCQLLRQDVTTLVQDVGNLVQMTDREKRKTYFKSVKRIVGHLQKQHRLVTEGYYMGIGMVIGTGIGVALGAAMDTVGSGIPIGIGIGMAIGAALDIKAKKEGRVICPSEKTATSPQKTKIMIIIGLGVFLVLAGILAFILFNRSA